MIKYRVTTLSKVTDKKSLEETKLADSRVHEVKTLSAKQEKHFEREPSPEVDSRISYSSSPENLTKKVTKQRIVTF